MAQMHGDPGDQAMGIELQAIELESELEWAEAQGRIDDARDLRRQLVNMLNELALTSERVWRDLRTATPTR
jgi:hypothetical protein